MLSVIWDTETGALFRTRYFEGVLGYDDFQEGARGDYLLQTEK
jgi:hypothetical protein